MSRLGDPLAVFGMGLGMLLVAVGLATILGQPWLYRGTLSAGGQILGGLFAVGVGVGLAWLTRQRTDNG